MGTGVWYWQFIHENKYQYFNKLPDTDIGATLVLFVVLTAGVCVFFFIFFKNFFKQSFKVRPC